MKFVTRFAPSPTGPLHLGHAYSALLAYDMAVQASGDFLLRIDDLDQSRARPEWEQQLKDDLAWLGISWVEPCRKQSEHLDQYQAALQELWHMGLLYPCTCSRRDIKEALSAPQEGQPMTGPDGLIYPGTCRKKLTNQTALGALPTDVTLRLNMRLAVSHAQPLFSENPGSNGVSSQSVARFIECSDHGFPSSQSSDQHSYEFKAATLINKVGDVVLSRKDMGASYHLAVVIDDAVQRVTHVVRGEDLLEATMIHHLLRGLLRHSKFAQAHPMTDPQYLHHHLIRDENGKRLAKRDDARAISKYRAEGATPADIRKMVGL